MVDSNVKKVQHPTGGMVGELRVRDGERVKAGDIVVRLDETSRAPTCHRHQGLDELRRARPGSKPSAMARAITFPG